MAYQKIFQRNELKYLITIKQKEEILELINPYVKMDKYAFTTVRNIYFDTDNYQLIRRSIEKPKYKEKLRIRCYKDATDNTEVFVELKKKYNSVVYKRRIALTNKEVIDWLYHRNEIQNKNQISNEIDYFVDFYQGIKPKVFLVYDREAYVGIEQNDLRITFDQNIRFRTNDLVLSSNKYGTLIIDSEQVIMEIKCTLGIPLFLTNYLSKKHIYKTSFSKYGTVYKNYLCKNLNKEEEKEVC